jgi:hypothetical protein
MSDLLGLRTQRIGRRLRQSCPGAWRHGIQQAERYFAHCYHEAPPRGDRASLLRLAHRDAQEMLPALMVALLSHGADPDEIDRRAVRAYAMAFERRLIELYLGLKHGELTDA